MTERIEWMARYVEDDADFLAAALAEYARSEELDDQGLADALGCAVETLTPLRLCLRPRPEHFAADIDEIASRFGIDGLALAEAVRRADALTTMRGRGARRAAPGTLMAARDREPPDADTDTSGEARP